MTVWVPIIHPGAEMARRAILIGGSMRVPAAARGSMWTIWMICLGVVFLNSSAQCLAWITPFPVHRVISRNLPSASKKLIKAQLVCFNLMGVKSKCAFRRVYARGQKCVWLARDPMAWIYI